ncbi:hypothetical protein [Myxococcus landrumensis]|uniref:Lipoprotein n=1 Tax=Myxococcus landrumensis TaxID=2813577 RepID=A0ABX7N7J2_9BACT|nr:hypothetical protein [Myxococcus landrumus]QSQ12323.1 hypothetical protein JY572_28715 [Myxococcus landrumus]
MRGLTHSLALLALLCTGCERMPEDPVFVYGTLQHLDGSPSAHAPVTLEHRPYTFDPYGPPSTPEPFTPFREFQSDNRGDYVLEVLAGEAAHDDTRGFTEARFRVAMPLEQGHGVFTSFRFDDDVELPPLRPWETRLVVSQGQEGPALSFAKAPPPLTQPFSAKLPQVVLPNGTEFQDIAPLVPVPVVQLLGPEGLVWEAHDPASPWQPNPYQLEDFPGVEAQVRSVTMGTWFFEPLGGSNSSVSFRVEWRGPRERVPSGTVRPVSRGATCYPSPVDAPCAYTDGSLRIVQTKPESRGSGVEEVVLSWETSVRPRRIVLRNLEVVTGYDPAMHVLMEGSMDGITWAPLADVLHQNFDPASPFGQVINIALEGTEADSPYGDSPLDVIRQARFFDMPLAGDVVVRHIRLRVRSQDTSRTLPVYALSELSVFE